MADPTRKSSRPPLAATPKTDLTSLAQPRAIVPPRPVGGSGSLVRREQALDSFLVDPAIIVLEPEDATLRGDDESPDFETFVGTIRQAGSIFKPLLVRQPEEDAGNPHVPGTLRLILVDGRRRYRAAERLSLKKIPVRNLGPMSKERARMIQIVANEGGKGTGAVDLALAVAELVRGGSTIAQLVEELGKKQAILYKYKRVGDLLYPLSVEERKFLQVPAVSLKALYRLAEGFVGTGAEYREKVRQIAAEARARGELTAEREELEDGSELSSNAPKGAQHPASGDAAGQHMGSAAAAGRKSGRPPAFSGEARPRFVTTENSRGRRVRFVIEWDRKTVELDPDAFGQAVLEVLHAIDEKASNYVRTARALRLRQQKRARRQAKLNGGVAPEATAPGLGDRVADVSREAVRRTMGTASLPHATGLLGLGAQTRVASAPEAPTLEALVTRAEAAAPPGRASTTRAAGASLASSLEEVEARAREASARAREAVANASQPAARQGEVSADDIERDLA